MLVSLLIGLYYNTLIAWILWYLFNSFQDPLPWTQCPLNENRTGIFRHTSCSSLLFRSLLKHLHAVRCVAEFVSECQRSSTVDYYFYRVTLNSTRSIVDSGGIHWPVVVCLLAAWTIIWICYIRGISTSGKVCPEWIICYIKDIRDIPFSNTQLLNHDISCLAGRVHHSHSTIHSSGHFPDPRTDPERCSEWNTVSLHTGCMSEIAKRKVLRKSLRSKPLHPALLLQVNELKNPKTWLDAGAQVFYAFSIAWGGLISFSSYNPVQ